MRKLVKKIAKKVKKAISPPVDETPDMISGAGVGTAEDDKGTKLLDTPVE